MLRSITRPLRTITLEQDGERSRETVQVREFSKCAMHHTRQSGYGAYSGLPATRGQRIRSSAYWIFRSLRHSAQMITQGSLGIHAWSACRGFLAIVGLLLVPSALFGGASLALTTGVTPQNSSLIEPTLANQS